jgi:GNAT superfamily N-acetyltransferase
MDGTKQMLTCGPQQRMLLEFEPQTEAMRLKAFPKTQLYHYIFFMGTRADAQGQGLGSELMKHQQDLVRECKNGLPTWLEATTARSRDLYLRLGFEVVDEILLGKGDVGADGMAEKDGGGVPVWGMVWWPQRTDGKERS